MLASFEAVRLPGSGRAGCRPRVAKLSAAPRMISLDLEKRKRIHQARRIDEATKGS
jgi:hypothetical protein